VTLIGLGLGLGFWLEYYKQAVTSDFDRVRVRVRLGRVRVRLGRVRVRVRKVGS
jgi:hypothetical protein